MEPESSAQIVPGVLVNARAGRVRRTPDLAERLRAIVPAERVRVSASADEVEPALAALRAAGANALVLVGGDGTVTGTLTPLLRTWPPDALPRLALCAGGTVNTISRSLGAHGSPERMLARLAAGHAAPRESQRAVVRVSADAGEPAHGLIFVNGVGVRFLELYYGGPRLGVRGAAALVARIAGSALAGGELARRTFSPFRAEVWVDGTPLDERLFTVMGAAGVQHIGLGFRPFASAGSDPRRIHFTATGAPAVRIVRELPALWRGRVAPGTRLRHFSARRVEVCCEQPEPWSLDAERFPPARRLEIEAGPTLRFLAP